MGRIGHVAIAVTVALMVAASVIGCSAKVELLRSGIEAIADALPFL